MLWYVCFAVSNDDNRCDEAFNDDDVVDDDDVVVMMMTMLPVIPAAPTALQLQLAFFVVTASSHELLALSWAPLLRAPSHYRSLKPEH